MAVSPSAVSPANSPAATSVPLPKQERYYRPELDVVRFIAFFFVFLHHNIRHDPAGFSEFHPGSKWAVVAAAFSNACGFGLGLFFCLSAYLICELLLREKDRSSTIHLSSFYVRRILRIWPLYFLGLAIGCLWAIHLHQWQDLPLFGAYALMAGNWFNIFVHYTGNPMAILWSISIEEQFYLFCPVAVRQLTRTGLYVLCAVILVLANITLFVLGNRHANLDINVWCNSLVQFEFFAVGILISLVGRGRRPNAPVWGRMVMLGAAFSLWFIACYVFHAKQPTPATNGLDLMAGYALAAVGCGLMIIGFLGFPARLLPSWMIWLGKVSFGLYVYHTLTIQLVPYIPINLAGKMGSIVGMILKFAITVLLAGLSYHFFESPFLKLKKRFEVIHSRPV